MDKKQDAVTQPAEQTAPAESAPVEKKDDVSQPQEETQVETPVESDQPEKKDSESVPYERFKQVNDELKTLKEQQAPAPAVGATEIPHLDPESQAAVEKIADERADARYETQKAMEFERKHPELQEDKVLAGTVKTLMSEANMNRQYLDQEEALTQAKKLLEDKIKPVQKEAQTEGFKEGKEVSKQKEQLGEVGSSNYREPQVDDKDLTAAEYAKKYNVPTV